MNFQGNFRPIGKIDPAELEARIDKITEQEWLENQVRSKRYEVHKDTQFIGLVFDEDFRHMKATRHPALDRFMDALKPILSQVAEYYETSPEFQAKFAQPVRGYFVRISLAKLLAGGEITEHRDLNFSLTHSHRVHIPIITNEKVWFYVGDEKRNLQAGEIIEINNRRRHHVENQSEQDRVHIIMDFVLPWEPCCCADKTHPGEPCTPAACQQTVVLKTPCDCYPEDSEFQLS